MTDVTTDTTAPSGEPGMPMVAPADAPRAMGTSEAARLLASLRKPKEQQPVGADFKPAPTTPPTTNESARATQAAAPAPESEAAPDAADDVSPAEPAPDGTQATEPAAEPAIDPPRSWTKEARERFASLPRETQEYVAERERERERELSRVQNDAAEARKAADAERTKVEQTRQQYEQALPQLLATLQAQTMGAFADIKTIQDVERLAHEDWPRYLQWDFQQKKLAAVQQELAGAQQRQASEQQRSFAEFATREDKLFAEKVPDMADATKATALQKAAVALLKDLGFDEPQLARAYNAQGEFSLRDHRVQMLVLDALRYREAQAKAKTIVNNAKPVPPVQRPGTAPARGQAQADKVQHLTRQLDGAKGMNATRIAAELLRARRAAS